ncbi:formylglycine-generating enzyme family protein [Sphingomonas sp. 37zxx]|uniref:formylglycine-generating enzyme family protein n=1 Tax=Sphingomonas sp. 37zxx TaxID=1550073 RepID=UPI0022B1C6E6|nr:formylglycine-generating enzyme family protein [Sphingomonas sp. 37zxx]
MATIASGCGGAGTTQPAVRATDASRRDCRARADAPIAIAAGHFAMGSQQVYAEEGPVRDISVNAFWIDPHEVTNRQFAAFVRATGYTTVAERPVDPALYGVSADQVPPDLLKPGSAVFKMPSTPSTRYMDWWEYVPGANWQKPYGPTGPDGVAGEPVAHLAYTDMEAYARWKGGRIPTEAEWEYAARAGGPDTIERPTEANSWQGVFPVRNFATDGYVGIAPVGCFKPNAWGLYDMVGNVWELTSDYYAPSHDPARSSENPAGPSIKRVEGQGNPGGPARVIKGGSYLCAPNYCRRYRAAARNPRDTSLGASNVGFRLVYDRLPS